MFKKQKGITLIALVITIIVLLILAGVTIALITSNESAPQKAVEAREANDKGAARDTAALLVADKVQGYYEAKYVNRTTDVATPGEYVNSALSSAVTQGDYKVVVLEGTLKVFEKNADITTANPLVYGVVASDGTINWGTTAPVSLQIGDTVNYSTSLNGVTLDDWSVFYVDGDYTYIIYDDYLPNSAISNTILTTYALNTHDGNYAIFSDTSSEKLISAMTTKSNWDSLLTGTINGHAVNEDRTKDVWAMGAPTVDLWVNSWNESYPSDTLYTKYENPVTGQSYDGWYIGDTPNPTTYELYLEEKAGYNNLLYFPHQTDIDNGNGLGYWLASPAASAGSHVMKENYNGNITFAGYGYDYGYCAFRPVVCLPTSVLNQ